jgi:hypothetical protein
VANCLPTKDCTAAMGYCMASDHDTRVSMSPQPPQDGRWATFAPVSYKNMALGEAQLDGTYRRAHLPYFKTKFALRYSIRRGARQIHGLKLKRLKKTLREEEVRS